MHIAGGLYREICLRPAWNAVFGSGGRAALCLAALSEPPTLHAYAEPGLSPALDAYRDGGVALRLERRNEAIAFAYFHPLSTPHLEPPIVSRCGPIEVRGDVVLRFGFVEGEAVVRAARAVYDPQGWRDPGDFRANGSEAGELALVLNEAELRGMTGSGPVESEARELIHSGRASVVVVKLGFRGAVVVDGALRVNHVPAFMSNRVFKIGTGDVFSATFAQHWGVDRCTPEAAARQASLAVARYAADGGFHAGPSPGKPLAVGWRPLGPVAVIGAIDTIGSHYAREEAVFRLREFGLEAIVSSPGHDAADAAASLILADGMTAQSFADALGAVRGRMPVVVLREASAAPTVSAGAAVDATDDFATALYRAAWAASSVEEG